MEISIEDGMWGPLLTIKTSRQGMINTFEVLLEKEYLQYLADIFQKAANKPTWFIDHTLAQGDFDAVRSAFPS